MPNQLLATYLVYGRADDGTIAIDKEASLELSRSTSAQSHVDGPLIDTFATALATDPAIPSDLGLASQLIEALGTLGVSVLLDDTLANF